MPTANTSEPASSGCAQRLLGRHVLELALDDAGLGALALAERLGDAEVGHLDLALLADEHVLGADVAVDDLQRLAAAVLAPVGVGQRPAHLGHHVERDAPGQGEARLLGAPPDGGEVPAVDQLEHHEVAARPTDRSRAPARCCCGSGVIAMWDSSTSMLRNCGSAEKAGRMRLTITERAKPSAPVCRARKISAMPPSAIFLVIA